VGVKTGRAPGTDSQRERKKKSESEKRKTLSQFRKTSSVLSFSFVAPLLFLCCSTRAMRARLASSSHASNGCMASTSQAGCSSRILQRALPARLQSRSLLAASSSPSASSSSSSRPASHLAASTSAPSQPASWRDVTRAAGRKAKNILLSGWRPER